MSNTVAPKNGQAPNPEAMSLEGHSKVIVVGNEKGGSGKSTTVMHLMTALLHAGYKVAALDLDARQATLSHYLENRRDLMARKGLNLPMPEYHAILPSDKVSRDEARQEDEDRVEEAVQRLRAENDFLVIDTPGSDNFLSRIGHSYADILVTPLNDSFVDLDVLAKIDPDNHNVIRPSQYAQMVFEQKMARAKREGLHKTFDWVVMRNRMGHLESKNQQAMDQAITTLAKRIGFRVAPGFSERVIFRELFLDGLTLLDLRAADTGIRMSMSHVAARQEVRGLLQSIGLPVIG
ncbi:division plane positioning ATPase MipZ [Aestuariispira insulae]|uniref:Chromosome partitioning protein n=1 Tax=Aestuariispira insulae TaxID=1461337 RepID=A0A3D9HX27_9PROT|nr:division plane positioning ATPase MipZ [Aestuariispira insulae]RED54047.1 chromosome partitioning protein [Aestuariispira insulae]